MSPLLLVYLDAYHLGDPLFLDRFAQTVKAHDGPLVLLHGTGEAAERALEAEGRLPERREGVLRVDDAAGRALVERSGRDLNRQIVHALNEAGVSALRLSGTERGLLRATGDGVTVGRTAWLLALARQGVVPVVALLADGGGAGVEVPPAAAVSALADALAPAGEGAGLVVVVFPGTAPQDRGGVVPAAPEVAERLCREGVRVRMAKPTALRGAGVPAGQDLP